MSTTEKLITFIISLLLLAAGIFLYLSLEEVETTEWTGLKGEARTNKLYPHRLFLKKMGVPASSIENIDKMATLPEKSTVIFLNTKRITLSQERLSALLEWVEHGGHLITTAYVRQHSFYFWSDELDGDKVEPDINENNELMIHDPLLNRLNIRVKRAIYLDEYENDDKDGAELWKIQLPNASKPFTLMLYSYNPLEGENKEDDIVKLAGNNFLIHRHFGEGLITLVSDYWFLEEESLGEADHAEFFWYLVHSHYAPSNVWLIGNENMPPLWLWLWQKAKLLIITLAIFLVITLYYLAVRFGPIVPRPALHRRRLLEHIHASGYHLWTYKKNALIDSARQALNTHLARKYPGWGQQTQQQQIQFLADHLALPENSIQQLLYQQKNYSAEEFTHLIQQLENLKRGL